MSVGKRNIGLDVLRAAAIIGVFLCHGLNVRVGRYDLTNTLGTGVELFFVLSGFLIGRICLRSMNGNTFSFWNFWRSRWWRTLPPYAAAVLLYVAVRTVYPTDGLPWYYGLFLQNYLGVTGFGPSWSLCVEEHFYLILPIVLFVAVRLGGLKVLRYVLPILFFIPLVLRFSTLAVYGQMPQKWFWLTHLHFEGLIAGVWLAYVQVSDKAAFARLRGPAKSLLPLIPMLSVFLTLWDPRPLVVDLSQFTVYAIGYAAWVRYLYDMEWEPVTRAARLLHAALVGTALSSYSIYLTHSTIDPAIRNGVLQSWHRGVGKSILVLSVTWLGGCLFYFLVERPTILSRDLYLKPKVPTREPLIGQPLGVAQG